MNWARVIAGVLVMWATTATAWGYTLTWTANTESDLAGYRIYSCSVSNCTRSSGNATLFATLGRETTFHFGTPVATQYYFITAYDFSDNESVASALVTYTPASSVPSAIGVSLRNFSFIARQGGVNPASQILNITNTGGGTLSWTLSESPPWLTLSPTLGSGNAAVRFTVTTGALATGTYDSTITVSATGVPSVTVPVTFIVTNDPVPVIEISPTSFSFAATQGGANPTPQTLNITNAGDGTLNWIARDNASWINLSQISGNGNTSIAVGVTSSSLAAGNYSGRVTVGATRASTVSVPVTLTITTGSYLAPAITMNPTSFSFTARQGANPAPRTLNIANAGAGVLNWIARDNARWIMLNRISGSGSADITVSITSSSLAVGSYGGRITLGVEGGSAVGVPVTLTITP